MLKVVHEESDRDATGAVSAGSSGGSLLLDEIVRDGTRQMLAALQAEVTAYIEAHRHEVDAHGRRLVVRNGYHAEREVTTAAGAVPVRAPRVNDKRVGALDQRPDRGAVQPEAMSPSQRPGTARSSASAGRWLIMISGATNFFPRPRVRASGTRSARPVRRPAVSSRRSAPRPVDVERLVDRLVRDSHRLIIGEVDAQPVADLFRAPRGAPPPVRTAPVTTPLPGHVRPGDRPTLDIGDSPAEALEDIVPEPCIRGELGGLGRRARRSACHCATEARYSICPPRVAAFELESLNYVDWFNNDRPHEAIDDLTPRKVEEIHNAARSRLVPTG